jgi:hypothetical protein
MNADPGFGILNNTQRNLVLFGTIYVAGKIVNRSGRYGRVLSSFKEKFYFSPEKMKKKNHYGTGTIRIVEASE